MLQAEKNNHGGVFMVVSKNTGVSHEYKVSRKQYKNYWYTHLKTRDSQGDFYRIGTFNAQFGTINNKGQQVSTKQALGAAWLFKNVLANNFEKLDEQVDVYHFGNCIICNKPLTDHESILFAVGPVCRKIKH